MRLKEITPEVYVADSTIVKVSSDDIAFLKEKVRTTPRGRVRLCAHPGNEDLLHEMFIVLAADTYIRPHKHFGKSESFHLLEGTAEVVVFDDSGEIREIIEVGNFGSGRKFFYRMSAPYYHTVLIRTGPLVLHETTNGPFHPGDAQFAPWSP